EGRSPQLITCPNAPGRPDFLMEGVRAFVCLRRIRGGNGARSGDGATGGDGVTGGATAVHAHFHRRDHAGAPKQRRRAETTPTFRPQPRLEACCCAETTPACRDHGAGAVVSARQRGFGVAGSTGGQSPAPRPRLFAGTTPARRNNGGVPKLRWRAGRNRA